MSYKLVLNLFNGKFEWVPAIGTAGTAPVYTLETGSPMGLLLALTYQL